MLPAVTATPALLSGPSGGITEEAIASPNIYFPEMNIPASSRPSLNDPRILATLHQLRTDGVPPAPPALMSLGSELGGVGAGDAHSLGLRK